MKKIKELILGKKQLILYLLFGVVTTVFSLAACYITLKLGTKIWHDEQGDPTPLVDILGSTAQWVVGVLVAFVTNKKWVFTEAEHGVRSGFRQLLMFSGARVVTYFVEVGINLGVIALLDGLGYVEPTISIVGLSIGLSSRIWAKVVSSVVVVISNYFLSKLVIFRKKDPSAEGN